MSEVQAKKTGGNNVEEGDPPNLEAGNHHVVDVEGHHRLTVLHHNLTLFNEWHLCRLKDIHLVAHTRNRTRSKWDYMEKDKGKKDDLPMRIVRDA